MDKNIFSSQIKNFINFALIHIFKVPLTLQKLKIEIAGEKSLVKLF